MTEQIAIAETFASQIVSSREPVHAVQNESRMARLHRTMASRIINAAKDAARLYRKHANLPQFSPSADEPVDMLQCEFAELIARHIVNASEVKLAIDMAVLKELQT